jgi:hypothetical protein
VETTLPQYGRLVKAPAFILMHPKCRIGLGDYKTGLQKRRFDSDYAKKLSSSFPRAITILQPTFLVCQGAGVAKWLKTAFDVRDGRIQKGELDIQVLEFTHQSSQGIANNRGGNDRTPYLLGTVEPRVKEALKKIDSV